MTGPAFGLVFFLPEGSLEAELVEIDENLIRAELTPAQRAASIARRREIWGALHPNSGQSLPENARGRPREFAGDTESSTGEAKRTVNLHLSRADALGPDLKAVIGTSLDKGVELDALKDMEPEARRPLIEAAQRMPSSARCSQAWTCPPVPTSRRWC